MRKHVLALLIVAPLLVVAVHAAGQQAAKTPPPVAKAAAPAAAPAQGPRPEQFLGKFPPLGFKPPKPSQFRHTLSNGLVVYIAEDHEIPWFEATLLTPVAGGGGGGFGRRGMEDEYTSSRLSAPAAGAAAARARSSSRPTSWGCRTSAVRSCGRAARRR